MRGGEGEEGEEGRRERGGLIQSCHYRFGAVSCGDVRALQTGHGGV